LSKLDDVANGASLCIGENALWPITNLLVKPLDKAAIWHVFVKALLIKDIIQ